MRDPGPQLRNTESEISGEENPLPEGDEVLTPNLRYQKSSKIRRGKRNDPG